MKFSYLGKKICSLKQNDLVLGSTLKERLEDPEVRSRFTSFLSNSQVVIVNDYHSGNELLQFPELGGG